MKYVGWLLILSVSMVTGRPTGTSGGAGGLIFDDLVLSPAVSDNIALIFEQFDTELVLCLEGERRGRDLYITDFRMPHILVSETGRVQAAGCRAGRRSVGTWHNHPYPGSSLVNSDPSLLARNCYLSRTDVVDFERRDDALVTVVSCAPQTFAYWKRSDVESMAGDLAVLLPPEGQLVHSEIGGNRLDRTLTQARKR
ncbi:MAG: hypothetical protein JSV86_00185 [Gemmatimonadota bacterium]|nr:MAG: hypothetical protein JSV86_00185 [Gemmatimonadota bacterium]